MVYARGCGASRVQGGVYLVTKLSEYGTPLDDYLIDPPVPVPDDITVPVQGMGHFQREEMCGACRGTGKHMHDRFNATKVFFELPCEHCKGRKTETVTHVIDYIGRSFYPNTVDDIEEIRAIGSSRRIPSSFPFHLLTERSKHFRVHERAYIENWKEYREYGGHRCPKKIDKHEIGIPTDICASIYWKDYEPEETSHHTNYRSRTIRLPCGKLFQVHQRPDEITPIYRRAFYMALPITGIEIVKSSIHTHIKNKEKAEKANLPVTEVDE